MLPISNGIVGLLTGHDPLAVHFEYIVKRLAAKRGLYAEISHSEIRKAHKIWQDRIVSWTSEIVEQWLEMVGEEVDASTATTLSHMKKAGALLWALNHEDLGELIQFQQLDKQLIEKLQQQNIEANVRDLYNDAAQIYQAYPNQALSFSFTCIVFNHEQYLRGMDANYEYSNPPISKHYLQNMCWFLLSQRPSMESLYMIFKTMDLFGIKHSPKIDMT